jgi:hypothetical protein
MVTSTIWIDGGKSKFKKKVDSRVQQLDGCSPHGATIT